MCASFRFSLACLHTLAGLLLLFGVIRCATSPSVEWGIVFAVFWLAFVVILEEKIVKAHLGRPKSFRDLLVLASLLTTVFTANAVMHESAWGCAWAALSLLAVGGMLPCLRWRMARTVPR